MRKIELPATSVAETHGRGWRRIAGLAGAAAALGSASAAHAQTGASSPTAPAAQPADYADTASWLCRPARADDACGRSDQDATLLSADGSTRIERFRRSADAPIDCFYVYPTVSREPTGNASLTVRPEEVAVVNQQFARFASVCRLYAPLYRQGTLAALHASMRGSPIPVDRELPYADVKAAWDYYLAHDNHGRGVVLIGHSQGSSILARLIAREIDGLPAQHLLVSAVLAGYRLQVPAGRDVGADFKSIPLCRSTSQTGCTITFASFRANSPPSREGKLFGASSGPGLEAACVNPAALGGGSGPLRAYLGEGTEMVTASGAQQGPWTNPPKPIATPFVEVPGLLSAECRNDNGHHFLAVAITPTPGGKRTNDIVGDLIVDGQLQKDWGLHRIDMNLAMGNLVEAVRAQGRAYVVQMRRGPAASGE